MFLLQSTLPVLGGQHPFSTEDVVQGPEWRTHQLVILSTLVTIPGMSPSGSEVQLKDPRLGR